jgi:hypothetical protein
MGDDSPRRPDRADGFESPVAIVTERSPLDEPRSISVAGPPAPVKAAGQL